MAATSELTKEAPVQGPESRFWGGSPTLLCGVVGAQALWLASTSAGKWGNEGSSCFEILAALLAAAACWQASRRSNSFATIFWRLSAATFVLWSCGALLNTYENLESATPDENQIGIFLI